MKAALKTDNGKQYKMLNFNLTIRETDDPENCDPYKNIYIITKEYYLELFRQVDFNVIKSNDTKLTYVSTKTNLNVICLELFQR